jgi:tetratricopeptide (TPR) repeat protein
MRDTYDFIEWLRRCRGALGLTQRAFAQQLGYAFATYRKLETAERSPSRAFVDRLADELRVSAADRAALQAFAQTGECDQPLLLLQRVLNGLQPPVESEQLPQAADLPPAPGTPNELTARHQLRAPLADFVGRVQEMEQLRVALQAERASAIICGVRGMGGIGKTELAYRVAHELRRDFPDGQLVLALGGSSLTPLTPEQVLQAVIRAFRPEAKLPENLRELESLYRSILHEQRVFILADDAGDASQVRALLPPSGCALLVTSRVRFSLPAMTTIDLETLGEPEAVVLLRNLCARLSEKEAQALARVCGGLPLALRVGGSVLHNDVALSVAAYLQSLADERQRLALLRDEDDGQLDVAATLALSYAQLEREAQQVFRELGVLVADFTADLAQAVVVAPPGVEVAACLRLLLRRNLVIYDLERGRWRLHDLLRDLARRELERAGEWEPTMWRYARSALQIAQATQEQYLAGGAGVELALAAFDAERAHIDAAYRWAQRHAETPAGDQVLLDAALVTRHIGNFRYNPRQESIPLWDGARTAARRLGDRWGESVALSYLGVAYSDLGELQTAITYHEQHLAIMRALGDHRGEGVALGNLGSAYHDLGEPQAALTYHEQDLAIAREIGDRRNEGYSLTFLGDAYMDLGELQTALSYFEQALAIAREIGDRWGEGIALVNLGYVYTELGESGRAIGACEHALAIAREIGDQRTEGYALSHLACAQAQQGDIAQATTTFAQALVFFHERGDRWGEAECHWQFGLALVQQGQREQALPLLRAAVAYKQEIGHAKAVEHAALVARLEAGVDLPPELLNPAGQRLPQALPQRIGKV